MITVAHDAAAPTRRCGEYRLMNAPGVQLFEQHVTAPTHCRNGLHLRRLRSMITVAGGAVRRGQVAALLERIPVHAGPVLVELFGRNSVLRHLMAVGVTSGAGLRKSQGVYRSQSVLYRVDVVNAVTIDTRRDILITGREALPVYAGLIKLKL